LRKVENPDATLAQIRGHAIGITENGQRSLNDHPVVTGQNACNFVPVSFREQLHGSAAGWMVARSLGQRPREERVFKGNKPQVSFPWMCGIPKTLFGSGLSGLGSGALQLLLFFTQSEQRL
jgi:hypothetical protein